MRIFRKLASVITAAVIAVSAMAVSAGAESIFDTAKEIKSGSRYTSSHPKTWDCADYKLIVSESGELRIDVTAGLEGMILYVFDSNGESIDCDNYNIKTGSLAKLADGIYFDWNDVTEKISLDATYKVKRGTYYIRVMDNTLWGSDSYKFGNRKVTLTATFPSASATTAKINYITINMSRGDSLSLGADLTGSGTVTWKSSKPAVAAVNSSGKITAKAKGTTVISAKCGKTTKKIKIKVS